MDFNKFKINWKTFILLMTFLLCYFYFDYIDLRPKIIRFALTGIFVGTAAFIANSRFSKTLKYILGAFLFTLVYLTPQLWNKGGNSSVSSRDLLGLWNTDSSEGYIIHLNVKEDSAYLSQSSINSVKSFKLSTFNDSLELKNGEKLLIYKYQLLNRKSQLILYNERDSLFFKKVK